MIAVHARMKTAQLIAMRIVKQNYFCQQNILQHKSIKWLLWILVMAQQNKVLQETEPTARITHQHKETRKIGVATNKGLETEEKEKATTLSKIVET